ncbi:MAG: hypothetical protein J2P26_02895 [Nocardiopsaceae bacterium]|nr:hypothetical protein [Nocardiopsaceae bacterium]
MTVWETAKALSGSALAMGGRSAKMILGAVVLAVVVTAVVPVALIIGVVLMVLGHVVVGLSLFGASIVVAIVGFSVAASVGLRHVRKLLPGRPVGLQDLSDLLSAQAGQAGPPDGRRVVHLDQEDYRAE